MPDCLGGIKACFSPGVCHDITLEEQLLNTYGIKSFLCDPSHERPKNLNINLSYKQKALRGNINDSENITLDEWLKEARVEPGEPIMLSMDIEGGEYEVLGLIDENIMSAVRIMNIELHYLHLLLTNKEFRSHLENMMNKLSNKFDIVHMKPNNHTLFSIGEQKAYTCIEITLLNKMMRRQAPEDVRYLPNELDTKNMPHKLDVEYNIFKPHS